MIYLCKQSSWSQQHLQKYGSVQLEVIRSSVDINDEAPSRSRQVCHINLHAKIWKGRTTQQDASIKDNRKDLGHWGVTAPVKVIRMFPDFKKTLWYAENQK